MNVELAYAAIERAERNPERFNMDWWAYREDESISEKPIPVTSERMPPCGTACCYAGEIVYLTAPEGTVIANGRLLYRTEGEALADKEWTNAWDTVERYAAKKLDITVQQSHALFYLDNLDQVKLAVAYLADNPDATEESVWRAAGHIHAADFESADL